jgi:hypothetical protein
LWYFSKLIKEDGSIITYPQQCATMRDKWNFTPNSRYTELYFYYSTCDGYSGGITDVDFWPNEKKLTSMSTDTYYITKLTNKEMYLKYEYIQYPIVLYRTYILTRN